jgi:hypothetical protein
MFGINALKAQSFEIQENWVNPNCVGQYLVKSGGLGVTPVIDYRTTQNQYWAGCYSPLPDQVEIYCSSCSPSTIVVPTNGTVVTATCTCLPPNPAATHNFSATLTQNGANCPYKLTINY